MKKLNGVATVIAKIFEICYWVACGIMAVMTGVVATGHTKCLEDFSDIFIEKGMRELSEVGFSITCIRESGEMIIGAYIIFFIAMFFTSSLMAMVFRNIYLTFKTAKGKTSFSKGSTPFQKDVVRMVREIGIFCISIPVIQLIMSIIATAIYGADVVQTSVESTSVIMGIIVLCLSQFFAYGTELEEQTEGLI